VPVVALLDQAGPAGAEEGPAPCATLAGLWKAEGGPCSRPGWMLQDAAPPFDSGNGSGKAAPVISHALSGAVLVDVCQAAPPFVGRVCHHRMRPGIGARVAAFGPRVHAFHAAVDAVGLDIEGGYHVRLTLTACVRSAKPGAICPQR